MRGLLLFALPLVTGSILFACSDDGGAATSPQPDAGEIAPPPQPDADVLVEAGVDAGAPVTVQVLGPNKEGVRVVFHDATGAVLETKLTDPDGQAKSTTTSTPAMVTALLGRGGVLDLVTWTAVEPGDVLGAADEPADPAAIGSLDVTFPGNLMGGPPPAEYQAALGSCVAGQASGATVLSLPILPACATAAPAVLGRAIDGNDAVLKYATAKPAASPPADGGAAAVTLGAWTDPVSVTLTGTNLPTGLVTAQWSDITGALLFTHPADRELTSGQAVFEAPPVGFADAIQPSMIAELDAPAGARKTMTKRVAPTTAVAFDFATALPTITGATLVATDPVRPEISWTSSTSLATADGGVVRVGFFDDRAPSFRWSFVVPPGATSVKAPALPPEASDWSPRVGDAGSSFDLPEITFVEADAFASAATFRSAAAVLIPAASAAPDTGFALSQDGAVRITYFQTLTSR